MAHAPLAACILAAALTLAGRAAAEDAPMVTAAPAVPAAATPAAPAAAAPTSVADQIEQYLKSSRVTDLPSDAAPGVTSGDEARKVHGEFDVAVGSGGYRSVHVRTDLPVGQAGTLSIAVGDTRFDGRLNRRFDGRFGARDYRSLGLGLAFSDAAQDNPGFGCPGRLDTSRFQLDDPLQFDPGGARRCLRADPPSVRP